MDHFAGLDVSVKETSAGIVDETGRSCRKSRSLAKLRIAGGLAKTRHTSSGWLQAGQIRCDNWSRLSGSPVIEERGDSGVEAQINKTTARPAGWPVMRSSGFLPSPCDVTTVRSPTPLRMR